MTIKEAFYEMPMVAALCLWPAAVELRGGNPEGPSAEECGFIRGVAAARARRG